MVYLVTQVLPTSADFPQRAECIRAGHALVEIYTLIKRHPRLFPVAAVQAFVDSAKRYMLVSESLGWATATKPKGHLMLHIGPRALWRGPPQLYGCWKD